MNGWPWLRSLFRPLVVGIMAACIALSVAQLLNLFSPTWNPVFLFVACVLAALEAQYSRHLSRRLAPTVELWKFRAIELLALFLLVKAGTYIGDAGQDIWADVRSWPRDPTLIINMETVGAVVLVFASWFASLQTTADLERLSKSPTLRVYGPNPMQNLSRRFFWGGAILLFVSGLTRIGLVELLNVKRSSVPGVVLNVLVYFVLGLVVLGQVQFTMLHRDWRQQQIPVSPRLGRRWVWSSLALVLLAAVIAFLLPTAYTLGLLDTLGVVLLFLSLALNLIVQLITLLLMLIAWPVMWVIYWLMGKAPPPLPGSLPSPIQFVRTAPPSGEGLGWWDIVRSILFWGVALTTIWYVVSWYLRDHPEIRQALLSFAPFRFLYRLWTTLRSWFFRPKRKKRAQSTRGRASNRAGRRRSMLDWLSHLGPRSPREQILSYYGDMLRRADKKGVGRRAHQTPYEYDEVLETRVPRASDEVAQLTDIFVEARYSKHKLDRQHAARARSFWERIKEALRKRQTRSQ